MENQNSYLKADGNVIINEKMIRWVQKMDECLEVCTKFNGCSIKDRTTQKICRLNNYESYSKLNKYFE